MDRIIYATDCSTYGVLALKFTVEFTRILGARLHLLHIYSLPPIENTIFRSPEQLKRNTRKEQLELLRNYYSKNISEKSIKEDVYFEVAESSSISQAILQQARLIPADLVIIGKKDEHSERGLLAGNIASDLLQKLTCPLLVIPNKIELPAIKNIVYASDFEADDILALTQLQLIAKIYGAALKVVHVPTKNEYESSEQLEWFKEMAAQKMDLKTIDFHLVLSNNVREGLQSFIISNEADVLGILEREEKGYLNKLFYGDMVKKMKSLSYIPMLIFNRKCFA